MALGNKTLEILITAKDRASKVFGNVSRGFKAVSRAGAQVGLGISAGLGIASAALTALSLKVLNLGDDLAKTADKLGITTEDLSSLRHAAQLAGVSIEGIDNSLKFMQRNLAEAADGTAAQSDAFKELGLSIEKLQTLSPADAMQQIVGALGDVENQSKKVQIAMDIFGRAGADILNMTAEGMAEARKEAELFGIAMSRQDAKRMENVNDAITRVKAAIEGASIALITQFTPYMEAIGNKMAEWAATGKLSAWAKDLAHFLINVIPQGITIVLTVFSRLVQAFSGWKILISEIEIQWLSFSGMMQRGIQLAAEALSVILSATNVNGMFDEQIKSINSFAKDQAMVVNQMEKDRSAALASQRKTIEEGKKEQQSIEQIKKDVDSFVSAIGKGTTEVVAQTQKVNALADSYSRAATAAQNLANINTGTSPAARGQRTFSDENLLNNLQRTEGGD